MLHDIVLRKRCRKDGPPDAASGDYQGGRRPSNDSPCGTFGRCNFSFGLTEGGLQRIDGEPAFPNRQSTVLKRTFVRLECGVKLAVGTIDDVQRNVGLLSEGGVRASGCD